MLAARHNDQHQATNSRGEYATGDELPELEAAPAVDSAETVDRPGRHEITKEEGTRVAAVETPDPRYATGRECRRLYAEAEIRVEIFRSEAPVRSGSEAA